MKIEIIVCILFAITTIIFAIALTILHIQNNKLKSELEVNKKYKEEQFKYLKWVNEQLHIQNKYLKINQAKCRIYKKYYEHNKKGF